VFYFSARHLLQDVSLYRGSTLFTGLGYPPVSVLPFVPLTWLPYTLSQTLWVLGSFVAFLGCVYVSLRAIGHLSLRNWALVSAFAYLSFPSKFTFGMGQANYYGLFLLLWSVTSTNASLWARAGLLTLALMFKPHFAFVYLGLLFTKQRASVWMSIAMVIGISLLLGVLGSWKQEWDYVNSMVPSLLEFRGRAIYYNQGIQAIVARFGGDGAGLWATAVSGIVFVISWVRFLWSKKKDVVTALGLFLPVQILVEPLAWQHHLVFLLPTFIFLWFATPVSKKYVPRHLVLFASYVLISWNIKNPLYWQENAWVLSHASWGLWLNWVLALLYL
jgi:alpha-1,2-mannosyltransferase